MACPKCGTRNGFFHYATTAHNSFVARGMSCLLCGYWMEPNGDNISETNKSGGKRGNC